MATGRMLKKNISTSRRFAELGSDTARMLYLLLLPHLDVKGRYSGDPLVIKGQITSRLRKLTEEKVKESLDDMNRLGLIKWYESDGDLYLEYRKFSDFQTLREGREAESEIPTPDVKVQTTPVKLPRKSSATTAKDKISKDKISKDNMRAEPAVNEINEVFSRFYDTINPGINFANETNRKDCAWLINRYGLEKTLHTIDLVAEVHGKPFAPVITTPHQLRSKLSALVAYLKREETESESKQIKVA